MPRHLPGPTVCGFHGFFETDYGDPSTPQPYPRITPSRVGSALLPFRCPRCHALIDFTSPARRAAYRDARTSRVNYYCPGCGMRFYLNEQGRPLSGEVDASGAASAVVERVVKATDGTLDLQKQVQAGKGPSAVPPSVAGVEERSPYLLGCDVIGMQPEAMDKPGDALPVAQLVVDVLGLCVAGTALVLAAGS